MLMYGAYFDDFSEEEDENAAFIALWDKDMNNLWSTYLGDDAWSRAAGANVFEYGARRELYVVGSVGYNDATHTFRPICNDDLPDAYFEPESNTSCYSQYDGYITAFDLSIFEPILVGVTEPNSQNNIMMFLNPSFGQLNIVSDGELDNIIVYDMLGHSVLNIFDINQNFLQLEVSFLSPGCYAISPSLPPFDIDFLTNEIGFVCGRLEAAEGTTVFKTIDGGYNWYTNENMYGPVIEMTFPSINIGYGIGDESRIWKTIDSGESWNMLTFDFDGYDIVDGNLILRNVYFFNDTIGYLEVGFIYPDFTEGIFIYRTNDGGNIWYKTEINHDEFDGINSIWCTSADTRYAVGCLEVYKTTNGGGIDSTTSIKTIDKQNGYVMFPNPSNNSITINFELPQQMIQINTFNYLGEEIDLYFDLSNKADISTLPNGIYLTEIITAIGKISCRWVKV